MLLKYEGFIALPSRTMRFKIKEKKVAKRLGVAVEVDGTLYFNLWQQAAYFSAKT